MLLLIDNYDSFTYNLAHYLTSLGAKVQIVRNDLINLDTIAALTPTHIVISPGPGRPNEAGISLAVIAEFASRIPILGVCLGHQCIVQAYGGRVGPAQKIMHGKTSNIHHQQVGLFAGLAQPFVATRYHSLVAAVVPAVLSVTAWTEDSTKKRSEVMAVAHQHYPLFGVQFHPEAILSEQGHALLNNFLSVQTC